MDMPQPTEHHRKLERIAGIWRGEEKMYPSPWDPEGGTATGHVNNRVALDGFAVVQDYQQTKQGETTFRGLGIFTWDRTRECYSLVWVDSMGYPPHTYYGEFEADRLPMTYESPQGVHRVVFELLAPDRYHFEMQLTMGDGQLKPLMEGTYSRIGD